MTFVGKLRETLREKMRDDFCAGLRQRSGIDAALTPRGRSEEEVKRANRSQSLGLIDRPEGQIRWVNIQKFSEVEDTYYCATYGVSDPEMTPSFPKVNIRLVRVKSPWFLGNVVRVE